LASTAYPPEGNTLHGIFWMILTGLLFAGVTGVVRHLGSDLPAIEGAFIRYIIGTVMLVPLIYRSWTGLPDRHTTWLYLLRGAVHAVAVMLWFFAMARIPIAEVTAIGYMAPIFVTIGAALFLGERLHIRRIGGVVVGFIGAMIIIRPGFQEVNLGQLAQLSAAPLFACSFIIAKKLTDRESPIMIVGMLSVYCTLALLPGAIVQWRTPTTEEVAWLTLTAFLATAGHYTLTKAFASAPITVTQPLAFLQLIWAMLMGIIIFGEPVDPFVVLGGAIVVAAVSYISHREVSARRKQQTPPAVATKV
jgi:drug/metabolite transporter (DMT)-like permease